MRVNPCPVTLSVAWGVLAVGLQGSFSTVVAAILAGADAHDLLVGEWLLVVAESAAPKSGELAGAFVESRLECRHVWGAEGRRESLCDRGSCGAAPCSAAGSSQV